MKFERHLYSMSRIQNMAEYDFLYKSTFPTLNVLNF